MSPAMQNNNDIDEPVRTEIIPGHYYAPGFYVDYWTRQIEARFTHDVTHRHVKLKQHRELWIGAVFAALQTKITGMRHYVGIPETDPPDVLVVRFEEATTPSGRDGTKLARMPIEITRCDIDAGETLLGQIQKKNTAAYSDTILLVYVYGAGREVRYQEIADQIKGRGTVHPSEILVIGKVDRTEGGIVFPPNTFAQTKLYPEGGQDLVNVADDEAFFRDPAVMTTLHRGVSTQMEPLGQIMLLPPSFGTQ